MAYYVIDTQALVKFLNGKFVINQGINSILQQTDEGKNVIIIPSVVLFEIGYLYEKKRITISLNDIQLILASSINYIEGKLSVESILSAFEITDIPELHDRLIAGFARFLNLPILTNDPNIINSKFVTCVK